MSSLASKFFFFTNFLLLVLLLVRNVSFTLEKIETQSIFKNAVTAGSYKKATQSSSAEDLCNSYDSPRALQLWHENIDTILDISLKQGIGHPEDNNKLSKRENREIQTWIKEMMLYMNPQRLLKSVKNVPTGRMQPIFDVLKKRKDWAMLSPKQQRKTSEPPPLKILVMGGSVTKGHLCEINPIIDDLPTTSACTCNWSTRLENMLNELAGFHAVIVENIAAGGTSSDIGARMYRFKMLPKSMLPQPDVVINAYSTNDMHAVTRASGQRFNNSTETSVDGLDEAVFQMNEDFIRSVVAPKNGQCHEPPLLIYLSDYMGNFVKGVKDTMIFNHVLSQLTSYYDVMYISYADAVRDLSLSNKGEYWFSPRWVLKDGKETDQIHLGMGGHLAITWVFIFNFIHAFTMHCDLKAFGEYTINSNGLRSIKEGRPGLIPESPLPAISSGIEIDDLIYDWNHPVKNFRAPSCDFRKPCIFDWMLGRPRMQFELPQLMDKVVTRNDGWGVEVDESVNLAKRGWAALGGIGSSFTIEMDNIESDVHGIYLFAMHSYGEQWSGSRAEVLVYGSNRVTGKHSPIKTTYIVGEHDSNTSITHPYEIELKNKWIDKGGFLGITITLVGGNYFKFTGMAFCDSV